MPALEKLFGNIIAGILLAIVILSIFLSFFSLLFRDGRGAGGLYGGRGEFYLTE